MTIEQHSPLGKVSAYIDIYEPSLLFSIPRKTKRNELGIEDVLPFSGVDIWNAYELSWLNEKGKPIVAIADFSIPITSPNLVESKSFKLYLNSFNQTKFKDKQAVEMVLARDLSSAVQANVEVNLVLLSEVNSNNSIGSIEGDCIDDIDVSVPEGGYTADSLLLKVGDSVVEETLLSHLLKSNCLVTGQPDWGSVIIHYKGPQIDRAALLRYLISFRQHNEFHEQCVERIFVDLMARCKCEELSVYARYVRRGGLDINPFRSNRKNEQPPRNTRLVRQ